MDLQKPQLIVKASHNFGVAIDTPNGLLVPAIKGVQNRSILSIAAEVKGLSTLAKEGSLSQSDMSGATFTVINIGSIGACNRASDCWHCCIGQDRRSCGLLIAQ